MKRRLVILAKELSVDPMLDLEVTFPSRRRESLGDATSRSLIGRDVMGEVRWQL